jgi:hypothetical protein
LQFSSRDGIFPPLANNRNLKMRKTSMRDLRLDELTHVYGGGGCNPQPSQKECKQTNYGQEKKSDCYHATKPNKCN